jgi:hypothetical protein
MKNKFVAKLVNDDTGRTVFKTRKKKSFRKAMKSIYKKMRGISIEAGAIICEGGK